MMRKAADVKTSKVSGKPPTAEMQKPDTSYVVSAESVFMKKTPQQSLCIARSLSESGCKDKYHPFILPKSFNPDSEIPRHPKKILDKSTL